MSAIEKHKPLQKAVREIRTVVGFIVAPLVPGVLVALPDLFHGDPMAYWYIRLSATVGYPVMFILGIPIYFLLRRWDRTGLLVYVATGALLGVAAYLSAFLLGLFMGTSGIGYAMTTTLAYLLISTVCGIIALIAFWLIARPDRPHE